MDQPKETLWIYNVLTKKTRLLCDFLINEI